MRHYWHYDVAVVVEVVVVEVSCWKLLVCDVVSSLKPFLVSLVASYRIPNRKTQQNFYPQHNVY